MYRKHLEELCRKTGSMLRIDHTYKFSKSLGVAEQAQRVFLKSSTLVVMNENGSVLKASIVPSDEQEHIIESIAEIINTENKQKESMPKTVFTDNVAAQEAFIRKCIKDLLGSDVLVLQVS